MRSRPVRRAATAASAATLSLLVTAAVPGHAMATTEDTTLVGHSFLFAPTEIPIPGVPPVTGIKFVLKFTDAGHMTFTQVAGPTGFGVPCENEVVEISTIRRGLYFVRWIEASSVAVSHVDDLRRKKAVVTTVIPTSITGGPAPVAVSFGGPLVPYRGVPLAPCTAT